MDINDSKLLKIALITSIIGLLGLLIFSPYIEVKNVKINEITKDIIDEEVSIEGNVEEIKPSGSGTTYFLTVNDGTGKITVIIFESALTELKDSETSVDMFLNQKVKINGKVTEYNSAMELVLSNGNSIKISK